MKRCPSCNGELLKINDDEYECEDCGRTFDIDDLEDEEEWKKI